MGRCGAWVNACMQSHWGAGTCAVTVCTPATSLVSGCSQPASCCIARTVLALGSWHPTIAATQQCNYPCVSCVPVPTQLPRTKAATIQAGPDTLAPTSEEESAEFLWGVLKARREWLEVGGRLGGIRALQVDACFPALQCSLCNNSASTTRSSPCLSLFACLQRPPALIFPSKPHWH
jgi:hypothetical protein